MRSAFRHAPLLLKSSRRRCLLSARRMAQAQPGGESFEVEHGEAESVSPAAAPTDTLVQFIVLRRDLRDELGWPMVRELLRVVAPCFV